MKKYMNKQGLTLVELMVAMGIFGIVLAVCFSFLFFGYRSFGTGSSQSNVQSDIRLAVESIKNEVRYASELKLLPVSDVPETVSDDYRYLYVEGGTLILKTSSGAVNKTMAAITGADPAFTVIESSGNYLLNVTLSGVYKTQDYSTTTDVLLQNVELTTTGSQNAIQYK